MLTYNKNDKNNNSKNRTQLIYFCIIVIKTTDMKTEMEHVIDFCFSHLRHVSQLYSDVSGRKRIRETR